MSLLLLSAALLVLGGGMLGARALLRRRAAAPAAAALERSEDRLRMFFHQVPAVMWTMDRSLRTTFVRGTGLRTLGLSEAELQGRGLEEVLGPRESARPAMDAHLRALTGECVRYPLVMAGRTLDCWVEPRRARNGEITGVLGLAVDVTRAAEASRGLHESETRFEGIVSNVPGMVYRFRLGPDGVPEFLYVSEGSAAVLGLTPEQVRAHPAAPLARVAAEDREGFRRSVRASLDALTPWAWEGRMRLADGEERWIKGAARARREPGGGTVWDGLMVDITEQRRTADDLASRLRMEEALSRVASVLLSSRTPLDEAVRVLGEALAVHRAYLYLFPEPGTAVLSHAWTAPGLGAEQRPAAALRRGEFTWLAGEFAAGRPVVEGDVERIPAHAGPERALLRRRGVRACVFLPLLVPGGGELLGFLGFDVLDAPRAWSAHDVRAAELMALMVAGVLARARGEAALEHARERQAQILSASPSVIYVVSLASGQPVPAWVSANLERLLGYRVEEALSQEWWAENLHPDDRDAVFAGMEALLAEGVLVREFRFRLKTGGYRWVRDEQRLVRDASGAPVEVVGSWSDITARKRGEEAQREQMHLLRALVDAIPIPVFCKDPQGLYFDCNEAYAEFVGREREEIVWHPAHAVLRPAIAEAEEARDQALLAAGGSDSREVTFARGDGAARAVILSRAVFRRADGALGGIVGTLQDITPRKRAEEALRVSEEHFRSLIENSTDLIGVVDAQGIIHYQSPSVLRILGYSPEELVGRRAADYLHPDDLPVLAERVAAVASEPGAIALLEFRCRDHAGAWHSFEAVVQNRQADAGGLVINARDVTERTEREASLRDLAGALENAAEGIARIGPDGRLSSVNHAYAAVLGRDPEALCGTPWIDAFHPDDREAARLARERLEGGRKRESDLRVARADGGTAFVHVTLLNAYDQAGAPTGWHCFMKDVTQWKQMAVQLQRAQKLEAIGQLAAGVAHEINTPIQYVGDNVRFLATAMDDLARLVEAQGRVATAVRAGADAEALGQAAEAALDAAEAADVEYLLDEMPRATGQALEGLGRVAEIVRAMKEFSHPGSTERTPVDLNQAIRSTLTVARNEWKYVARLVTELDPELPPVPCLPGDVNQVILNLVVNAAHAIGEVVGEDGSRGQGTITVTTRRDGDWAEIRVADTGNGIPEGVRGRVFDPFFTTKRVGRGTGQGLTLAHAVIVDKHGGSLAFETETGVGTTFIIRLALGGRREAITEMAA